MKIFLNRPISNSHIVTLIFIWRGPRWLWIILNLPLAKCRLMRAFDGIYIENIEH
jgi:hypothetical protein